MIYKIELLEEVSTDLLQKLKHEHKDKAEGIYELYDELDVRGICESYCLDRIYYVAYTLVKNRIDIKVTD